MKKDIRKKKIESVSLSSVLWTILIGVLAYRVGSSISVPFVGVIENIGSSTGASGTGSSAWFLSFLYFCGGSGLSIFILGISPYISSSILFQILPYVFKGLSRMKQEDSTKWKIKVSFYSRVLAVFIAIVQSIWIIIMMLKGNHSHHLNAFQEFIAVTTVATGSMILFWIGEQMTNKFTGSGVSLIIFLGIASRIPFVFRGETSSAMNILMYIIALLIVLFAIVYCEGCYKKIPLHSIFKNVKDGYSRMRSQKLSEHQAVSYLPIKMNCSGILPLIFMSSVGSVFGVIFHKEKIIELIERYIHVSASITNVIYDIFALVCSSLAIFILCYVCSEISVNPKEISENLKKSGLIISGIRPGNSTETFVSAIIKRLAIIGALYTIIVYNISSLFSMFGFSRILSGLSLLILISIAVDIMTNISLHLFNKNHSLIS